MHIEETNLLVFIIGVASNIFLLIAKYFWPELPKELVLVFITGLLVHLFGWQEKGIRLIGELGGMDLYGMHFHIPQGVWIGKNMSMLLLGGGAVALLSLLEAVSVAKGIAMQTGQRIDINREFIGQGLASIAGGFFRGIPTSGSLTRSAINFNGGAATRAASGISGLLVFIFLLVCKDWIGYIPVVSLSGIIVVSAIHMIDIHHLKVTWHSRQISKIVLGVTFSSVLLLPFQISIYLGVGLSVVFYLIETSHLSLTYLLLNRDGKFAEYDIEEVCQKKPDMAVINVEGPLYFAAVQDLEDRITEMIDAGVKIIVLRLRRMHLLASSGDICLSIVKSFFCIDKVIFSCNG